MQERAAKFVTGNYNYETGSMTGNLEQLKWESLKKRRKDSRLIMLNKGLKGAASIPTSDLVPLNSHTRNNHSLAFQTPLTGTDIYKSMSMRLELSIPLHVSLLQKIQLLSLLLL